MLVYIAHAFMDNGITSLLFSGRLDISTCDLYNGGQLDR